MSKKHRSDALAIIHETASDLYCAGGMDQGTMHKFDALCLTPIRGTTLDDVQSSVANGEVD